jgi:uncharacterized protein YjdB
LTEVIIPNYITEIGIGAFSRCTGLTEVTIPNSVTEIGSSAFSGCTGLTEVTIPNSVTSIGSYAFDGCNGLKKFTIEDGDNSLVIGDSYRKALWSNPVIETLYIGRNIIFVTDLSYDFGPFASNSHLISVTFGNKVTEIHDYAFYGCTGLTEVTIPNSVTKIGDDAFYGCTGLTEVTIPNSVTKIGSYAFYDCTGLKGIESQAVTPPTIQWNTFSDSSIPLLAANEDYKVSDYWKSFTTIVIPYTPTGTIFEVDGLKYEIISINDLTCRLYAIDETVIGENIIIPETVVYKNRSFTPIEIKGILINGESSVKTLSIPSCIATVDNGIIFNSSLEKLIVNTPITTNFICASNIDELVISSSVTKVSAYLNSNNIGRITIEDSETALTTSNFKCEAKEVYLGRNVSASTFKNMTTLEKVTISDKVTEIGSTAFYGCSGLMEVTIPNSVTWIGVSAFEGCSGITELNFEDCDEDVTIGTNAFKDVTPTTAYLGRKLSSTIFKGNTKLTSITIGEKVTSIGGSTFRGCTGLTDVTIPNSVISIGESAFEGCTGLTEVNIGNSVSEVGKSVFYGCTGLTEVTIPNSVTKIGDDAFSRCTGLTEMTIPSFVTEIGSGAFSGCTGLTEVAIPNSVTKISGYTFNGCTGLTEVIIPNSVTSIDESAFNGCSGITSINFKGGEGILSTGTDAFADVTPTEVYFGRQMDYSVVSHTALETVEFGENVTSIESGAFKDGAAIRTVASYNTTPPTTDDIFCNDTYLEGILYVPEASIEAYQSAAGWKNFFEVEAISSKVTAVKIDKTLVSMHETETATITAKINPSFANNQEVIWSASDESVAKISVDETTHICTVTAVAPGTCNIVAKSAENAEITTSCTITVLETTYPESIELSEETVTLQEGNSKAVVATITPEDVDVKTVTWSSSNEEVATVSEFGKIIGVTEGVCDIIATTANGLEAVCHVIVIERTDPVFYEGLVYKLNKTDKTAAVTYASSAPKYSGDVVIPPFIVRDGVEYTVTEIGEEAFSNTYGNNNVTQIVVPYTVKSIAYHGFLRCQSLTNGLVLGRNVSSIGEGATGYTTSNHIISLNPTPPTMGKDCGWYFNVSGSIYVPKGSKSDYQDANIWSGKKSQIVELDFVSSISVGSSSARKAASLSGNALTMKVGEKYVPEINVEPEDAYTGAIYWKSSDEGVAYVSEYGKITAYSEGECTIKAIEVLTGASATINVKVLSQGADVIDLDAVVPADFSVDGGAICVSGDVPVRIVAINGRTVYSGRGDARVNVTPGIYVVIVGNTAHKICVK